MFTVRTGLALFVALSLMVPAPLFAEAPPPDQETVKRELPTVNPFKTINYEVEAIADTLEYGRDQKRVIAKGNVVLTHGNIRLTSDYAEVETDTKQAYAKGHVLIFKNNAPVARGEEVHYNFETEQGQFPDGRMITFPWYARGHEIEQVKKGKALVRKGGVTTCDRESPHYEIKAKKVTIYTGDKMIAQNVTFYVLNKPVFWWPYLIIPLNERNFPISVTGGYNSRFGAFIEATKGISINKNISGEIQVDWRSRRGVGGGGELEYDYGKWAKGKLQMYITQDKRAPHVGSGGFDGTLEERERGRITYRHRTDFNEHTHVILRYNRIEDEFFLQEFFQKEHRADVEPQSFASFTHNSDHHGLLVYNEKQMNRYEALVQRLPEVRFDWKNQQFFMPWLYYQNQDSFSHLNKVSGRTNLNEDVVRSDSNHTWYAPMNVNQIKFTPKVNLRGTYYSREKFSSDDQFRALFSTGADLRTQFYKTYPVSANPIGIEINHLRHVFEPVVQYEHRISSVSDETLSYFDNIDRIDDAGIVSMGIENRLQTKRVVDGQMKRVDIVSLNTYLHYELYPDGRSEVGIYGPFEDGHTRSNFSVLSQEIVLRPYEWLQYEARADYDVQDNHLRVLNQDLLARVRKIRLLIGHRFIQDVDVSAGSNQFVFDIRWMINPLWTLGGYVRWDSETQELDEWQVTATRDLHDFLFDFGYNVRNSTFEGAHNKTLFFNLRMKAFPFIHVRGGGNFAEFSAPRIGETVAGANQASASVLDGTNPHNLPIAHRNYY